MGVILHLKLIFYLLFLHLIVPVALPYLVFHFESLLGGCCLHSHIQKYEGCESQHHPCPATSHLVWLSTSVWAGSSGVNFCQQLGVWGVTRKCCHHNNTMTWPMSAWWCCWWWIGWVNWSIVKMIWILHSYGKLDLHLTLKWDPFQHWYCFNQSGMWSRNWFIKLSWND